MNILFITWDGPQVSYLEGLFTPIFERLREAGLRYHVLQFTWGEASIVEQRRRHCEERGIPYQAVRVWRRPSVAAGSLLTALRGAAAIGHAARRWDIDVLHPRSTLPALAALRALKRCGLPMVFDADGLPLDERVDFAGQSPTGPTYRLLRDVEAQTVRRARVVLTRSAKAADILLARAGAGTGADKFRVVGNGRDHHLFQPRSGAARAELRQALGLPPGAPVLAYAGSLGPQYCFPEMMRLFGAMRARRADARLLLLTGSPETARRELAHFPDLAEAVVLRSVPASEVPAHLDCADLGLALRSRSFSMQGVAPIKIGEYLLCGLPVAATRGVGQVESLDAEAVRGLDHTSAAELEQAADWFVSQVLPRREALRLSCRQVGMRHHSLDASVQGYAQALETLRAAAPAAGDTRLASPISPA